MIRCFLKYKHIAKDVSHLVESLSIKHKVCSIVTEHSGAHPVLEAQGHYIKQGTKKTELIECIHIYCWPE